MCHFGVFYQYVTLEVAGGHLDIYPKNLGLDMSKIMSKMLLMFQDFTISQYVFTISQFVLLIFFIYLFTVSVMMYLKHKLMPFAIIFIIVHHD